MGRYPYALNYFSQVYGLFFPLKKLGFAKNTRKSYRILFFIEHKFGVRKEIVKF